VALLESLLHLLFFLLFWFADATKRRKRNFMQNLTWLSSPRTCTRAQAPVDMLCQVRLLGPRAMVHSTVHLLHQNERRFLSTRRLVTGTNGILPTIIETRFRPQLQVSPSYPQIRTLIYTRDSSRIKYQLFLLKIQRLGYHKLSES